MWSVSFLPGLQLGSWQLLREKARQLMQHVRTTTLNDARIDILAPRPIRGLIKLALRGDKKVKNKTCHITRGSSVGATLTGYGDS